jgi:hypothetical protein
MSGKLPAEDGGWVDGDPDRDLLSTGRVMSHSAIGAVMANRVKPANHVCRFID